MFAYYERQTAFRAYFEAVLTEYSPHQLHAHTNSGALISADPTAYRRMRQSILRGSVFIDDDLKALCYQKKLSQSAGGDIYIIMSDGREIGCAVVEPGNEAVIIKELLLHNGHPVLEAAGLVAREHIAKRYVVRYPTNIGHLCSEKSRPFGDDSTVLKRRLEFADMQTAKWYGPGFRLGMYNRFSVLHKKNYKIFSQFNSFETFQCILVNK